MVLSIQKVLRLMREMIEEVEPGTLTALGEMNKKEKVNPFKILVSTVLSHRTRDENTSKATNRLFSVIKTPQDLLNLKNDEIVDMIRTVGFYNVKAKRLKELALDLLKRFNGIVPRNLKDLLTLPAVGRKTANCVLVYGFNIPAIPVDTHVHRIANRLGLVCTNNPDETESELSQIVSRKYWLDVNELFVRFGQTVCKPISPICRKCKLNDDCKFYSLTTNKCVTNTMSKN